MPIRVAMRLILILLCATFCKCNFTFNETTAPFNANITTVAFFTDFTVSNESYASVCENYSHYVDLICDCLRTSNPEYTYTCAAESIDDIPCVDGNCKCIQKQNRRLLFATMSVGARMTVKSSASGRSATLEKASQIANTPPGTSDYSTRDANIPDNVGIIAGSTIGGVVGVIMMACCIYRLWCTPNGYRPVRGRPPP